MRKSPVRAESPDAAQSYVSEGAGYGEPLYKRCSDTNHSPTPHAQDYPALTNFSPLPQGVFRGDLSVLRLIVQLALED